MRRRDGGRGEEEREERRESRGVDVGEDGGREGVNHSTYNGHKDNGGGGGGVSEDLMKETDL